MNPSASGWLLKCLHQLKETDLWSLHPTQFYTTLRSSGFIYGTSQSAIIPLKNTLKYTQEELAKINLFVSLVYVDYQVHGEQREEDLILRLIDFYKSLHASKAYIKSVFSFNTKAETKLEQLIHKRVQTNEGVFQKNFSHLITNALLFTDVLTYQRSLVVDFEPVEYEKSLEGSILNIVYHALDQKTSKGKYDLLILKLLKSSLRYNFSTADLSKFEVTAFKDQLNDLGKLYLFDIACMTVYSDEEIELNELSFMNDLGTNLQLDASHISSSIEFLFHFVSKYKSTIAYFNFSNPLNHFYKRNKRAVKLLLTRNKKRLYKEIIQSKELVYLISQSTHRELNTEEKAKVKKQLYDIFKSIPSLAIFVLPGGSVLLPIIIKFIPQLLPSAFNENLDNDE